MHKHARMIATLTAAGALLALPATGLAQKGGHGASKGKAKSCATAKKVAYQVGGTLESVTLDDPATAGNQATITLKVIAANMHARRSGELADQNATKKGVQVKGAMVTVAATDAFTLKLNGFAGTDTPSVGDRVRVSGKIAVTKKHCAAAGTTTADRYAEPDVRTVTISDRDADV